MALLALALGKVSLDDLLKIWRMVSDSTLTLVGLIVLCYALERLSFFDFLARTVVRFSSHKNGEISRLRFYMFMVLFASFLSAFFTNDGAILILTPLVFALFKLRRTNGFTPFIIFLLCVSFVSDFASNFFVISNLTNIITARFFNIDPKEFSLFMLVPQLCIILGILALYPLVRRFLPQSLVLDQPLKSQISTKTLCLCFGLIVLLLFGIFFARKLHLPLCSFTLFSAFLALIYHTKGSKNELLHCLKFAPFGVVIFSLGLFIVVYGLKNDGALEFLVAQALILSSQSYETAIFSIGVFSSLGSSVINNLAMVMFGNLALENLIQSSTLAVELGELSRTNFDKALIFSHLLGCNVGAKLTPIGSLATLLWLESLKKHGIHIGFLHYMLVSFCVSVPILVLALLGLVFFVNFL